MAEKEYIEREALLNKFRPHEDSLDGIDATFVVGEIEQAPAADVAPIRHGRWIKTIRENGCAQWTDFTCSVCGSVFDGNNWLFNEWKGCPVCLARIDGKV